MKNIAYIVLVDGGEREKESSLKILKIPGLSTDGLCGMIIEPGVRMAILFSTK